LLTACNAQDYKKSIARALHAVSKRSGKGKKYIAIYGVTLALMGKDYILQMGTAGIEHETKLK